MTLGNPFFQWNRLLYLTGRFDIGFIKIDYIDHQNLTWVERSLLQALHIDTM